jgi:hypothetical protein
MSSMMVATGEVKEGLFIGEVSLRHARGMVNRARWVNLKTSNYGMVVVSKREAKSIINRFAYMGVKRVKVELEEGFLLIRDFCFCF